MYPSLRHKTCVRFLITVTGDEAQAVELDQLPKIHQLGDSVQQIRNEMIMGKMGRKKLFIYHLKIEILHHQIFLHARTHKLFDPYLLVASHATRLNMHTKF